MTLWIALGTAGIVSMLVLVAVLGPGRGPSDPGDGTYTGPGRSEEEVSKSLKKLRRIVLDLVFNPFVYFGGLIFSVLMFMARFRAAG